MQARAVKSGSPNTHLQIRQLCLINFDFISNKAFWLDLYLFYSNPIMFAKDFSNKIFSGFSRFGRSDGFSERLVLIIQPLNLYKSNLFLTHLEFCIYSA